MRQIVLALLLTVVDLAPLLAQQSGHYGNCISKASTQLAMNACAKEEALRADLELISLYQKLASAAVNQPGALEKIRAAEKAWIAYRDAFIEAVYFAKDKQAAYGSVFPMEVDLLRAKMTQQQIETLRNSLKRLQFK